MQAGVGLAGWLLVDPRAWAEELVLGRDMNETVCLQVSAGSDAQRMYK